jgi:hypothetical protein
MVKHTFVVTVKVSDEATRTEVRDFVREAVECWGGQLHPDDPFFNLRDKVTVKRASAQP